MNAVASIKHYIDRVVKADGRSRGMKVLLLDAATTQIVSCVYSQTEILSEEVYLVSRLDDPKKIPTNSSLIDEDNSDKKSHLKAVCFLRPTEANAGLLVRELTRPRFAEYHIFFTSIVSSGLLRLVAESDVHERVQQVQEFYGDFLPVDSDLITLNCRDTMVMSASSETAQSREYARLYERNRHGLQCMLLALRRQPRQIRYQASSGLAGQLAKDVHEQIRSDQIFHFRPASSRGTLLLVIDRMDDPVTPLLSQWTYQAMVHELLGLNNHRVVLKGAPHVAKDLEEVVLNTSQDDFFRRHRNSNFGELGEAVQGLLRDYRDSSKGINGAADLETIEDMQSFMERFPELRSRSHTVSKHVAIMGELARLVDVCSLMDVGQFEQELACCDDQATHRKELLDKLGHASHVKVPDKLRLGMLFALRYERSANLHEVRSAMIAGGVPDDQMALFEALLRYAGVGIRGPGLYGVGTGGSDGVFRGLTKMLSTGVLPGVENVYSQHKPVLIDTLEAVQKGRLGRDSHPFVTGGGRGGGMGGRGGGGGRKGGRGGGSNTDGNRGGGENGPPPDEVIVFMIGGVTYEEATKVSEFNETHQGKVRVVLGGSTIHNSTSFLEELRTL